MNFSPRMKSQIHGFSVVALNSLVADGVVADLWDVRCVEGAGGSYVSPDPRLFVAIALEGGGSFDVDAGGPAQRHATPLSMSYIPAGMAIRGHASNLSRIKHLDLHFAESAVTRRFGQALDRDRLREARLPCGDAELASLAALIASECENPRRLHESYGSALINALLARLFAVPATRPVRAGLTRPQLRRVTDLIEARCLETIRLSELAALVGMSETHFSHAFKASTGLPPHRWQMRARIHKAQQLLMSQTMSLSEVAATAGFSDQAHFTRVFKSVTGLTPARWRKGATPDGEGG